jgi:hypothetical protein
MTREEKRNAKYENLKKCRQFINKKLMKSDLKDLKMYVDISRHLGSIITTK